MCTESQIKSESLKEKKAFTFHAPKLMKIKIQGLYIDGNYKSFVKIQPYSSHITVTLLLKNFTEVGETE